MYVTHYLYDKAIHTCAKDMQWESSSTLPTTGDGLCPHRLGNLIPSKTVEEILNSYLSSWAMNSQLKRVKMWQHRLQGKETLLPEEGLLLRGEGGTKVKSGWIGGLLLWGGEPNAGKCWRFSKPICTSGSKGTSILLGRHYFYASNFQTVLQRASQYLHLPCFLFSSISMRFSLRLSSLAFFCLRRFLFSNSSKIWGESNYSKTASPQLLNSRPEKQEKHSDLQMCPEFLWRWLVAVGLTHKCWTHRWVADEPGSDAFDGSPANKPYRRNVRKENLLNINNNGYT